MNYLLQYTFQSVEFQLTCFLNIIISPRDNDGIIKCLLFHVSTDPSQDRERHSTEVGIGRSLGLFLWFLGGREVWGYQGWGQDGRQALGRLREVAVYQLMGKYSGTLTIITGVPVQPGYIPGLPMQWYNKSRPTFRHDRTPGQQIKSHHVQGIVFPKKEKGSVHFGSIASSDG